MMSRMAASRETILNNLRLRLDQSLEREKKWRPRFYRQNNQQDEATATDRDQIVVWIARLNSKLHFSPDTLALAAAILDSFSGLVKVRPRYLRIVALACFYLAAKIVEEGEQIPSSWEVLRLSECGCSLSELQRMELCICNKLDWDLLLPTAAEFVHIMHAWQIHMLPATKSPSPSRRLTTLTLRLQAILGRHASAAVRPCALALAVWSLELEVVATNWLQYTLIIARLCQVDTQELINARELSCRVLQQQQQLQLSLPVAPAALCCKSRESYASVLKRGLAAASFSPDSSHPAKRRNAVSDDADDFLSCIGGLLYADEARQSCAGEAVLGDAVLGAAQNDAGAPLCALAAPT